MFVESKHKSEGPFAEHYELLDKLLTKAQKEN